MSDPRPMLVTGGRIVDPSQGLDAPLDLLLAEGKVARIGAGLEAPEGAERFDASGLVVAPGLIDLHVHLREPGGEHKETIASGVRSAAAGGFTAVCSMPNTSPTIDSAAMIRFVKEEGRRAGGARVWPLGAISVGLKGERLAAMAEMVDAGAVGITDDGHPVMDSGLMRLAMEYSRIFDIPVADHPEDLTLSRNGMMNEGLVAARLGLRGKPNASEDIHILRDILLAELTGAHLHLQHISTAEGVAAIRRAKERGIRVTGEASPHHLLLTDEAVDGYRTEAKMNPPLRSDADRAAVREGLRDGTLEVIATDHAPHHVDEKQQPFDDAPNGIVGLETSLALMLTHVVGEGILDLPTLIDRMSCRPARIFALPGGTLREGENADVSIFSLTEEWTVDPAAFLSKSRNTPFAGWTLRGRPRRTIVEGRTVFDQRA